MTSNGRAAIFSDANCGTPIEGFSSLKVNIIRSSRVIGAPVETGQISFDNKVIDPTKVVVNGVVVIDRNGNYAEVIGKLKKMFENREYKFYSVSNGVDEVRDLILQTYPEVRDVDKYDFVNIELTFVQALKVQSMTDNVSNKEDSSSVSSGTVSATRNTDAAFSSVT